MKTQEVWYNFKTNEYDWLSEIPTDFRVYIPQEPPAQSLYNLYTEMGDEPIDAAIKILEFCVGVHSKGEIK